MDTPHNNAQRSTPDKYAHIQGWGADLDHNNRPAYPMERHPPRLDAGQMLKPAQQAETVEVLVSTERPHITPLFGTPQPPSGLSGSLRRAAFKHSENDLRHWLMLLLADRVNMVEGLGADLKRGHVPNVFSEMGLKAEFKYNRSAAVKKVAVAGAVLGLAGLLLVARSRQRRRARQGER